MKLTNWFSSSGHYRIIHADPPWRFKNWSMKELVERGEKWARKNGRSPYPVMTTDDICKMPVEKIADKNSLLYLWGTWPKLLDALQVMDAWGFTFTTQAFTWVKQNPSGIGWHFGCGYYTHGNTEFVLIGKRGKGVKRVDKGVSSLIVYPRCQHSAKPPTARDRIERLHGDVSRVELFARQPVNGWDVWGNEVEIISPKLAPLADYIAPPYEVIVDEDEYQSSETPAVLSGMPPAAYEPGEQMALV